MEREVVVQFLAANAATAKPWKAAVSPDGRKALFCASEEIRRVFQLCEGAVLTEVKLGPGWHLDLHAVEDKNREKALFVLRREKGFAGDLGATLTLVLDDGQQEVVEVFLVSLFPRLGRPMKAWDPDWDKEGWGGRVEDRTFEPLAGEARKALQQEPRESFGPGPGRFEVPALASVAWRCKEEPGAASSSSSSSMPPPAPVKRECKEGEPPAPGDSVKEECLPWDDPAYEQEMMKAWYKEQPRPVEKKVKAERAGRWTASCGQSVRADELQCLRRPCAGELSALAREVPPEVAESLEVACRVLDDKGIPGPDSLCRKEAFLRMGKGCFHMRSKSSGDRSHVRIVNGSSHPCIPEEVGFEDCYLVGWYPVPRRTASTAPSSRAWFLFCRGAPAGCRTVIMLRCWEKGSDADAFLIDLREWGALAVPEESPALREYELTGRWTARDGCSISAAKLRGVWWPREGELLECVRHVPPELREGLEMACSFLDSEGEIDQETARVVREKRWFRMRGYHFFDGFRGCSAVPVHFLAPEEGEEPCCVTEEEFSSKECLLVGTFPCPAGSDYKGFSWFAYRLEEKSRSSEFVMFRVYRGVSRPPVPHRCFSLRCKAPGDSKGSEGPSAGACVEGDALDVLCESVDGMEVDE